LILPFVAISGDIIRFKNCPSQGSENSLSDLAAKVRG